MASRLDLHGVDEFINLTFCCQEVTVVTDFNNLESLGRRHYLTLGGGASMEEMQGKDFRSVALALLDGEVGRVTPYGVVYDNGFEMSQLYDGRNFPEYCYEDCIMEVEMSSRVCVGRQSGNLPLPDLSPHFVHGLQKLLQSFGREVFCLNGNENAVCGSKRIDCQHTERRHTVQQNVVVIALHGIKVLLQDFFAAHGVHKRDFHAGQFYIGRHEINPLAVM
jgi:hypothetical protein